MKKSLLLFASLLVSVASFAQWTKPVPKAVDSFEYSTFAEEGGDTIVYYLYNKDAKAFFTEGNAWGTQASISETGLKVAITKYIPEDGEWDGKTVFFNDFSLKKSAWKKVFIDSESQSFVDLGNQTNYYWEIPSVGTGLYHIMGAEINPTYNAGYLFGIDGNAIESGATTIAPYIDPAEDLAAQVIWQFVTPEEYDAYQALIPTYTMAVKLGAAIETAKNYDINTSSAETVYNNTSSTLEQLTEAYDALNDAIKKAEFGDATEDNPKDCTSWLVNADFGQGSANGWDCTFEAGKNATNIGYQSAKYTNGDVTISQFIEAWTPNAMNENIPGVNAIGVGQLSQTIKNMPQGKYKLTVDCIAVAQNVADNNPVKGVQLFATGGDLDVYTAIATGNGQPEHFELVFVNDGDDITMGLRTTAECVANWIAADNFTLTYYGPTSEDPAKINMDVIVKAALEAYPEDEFEKVKATQAVKDEFTKAIEDANAATEEYTAAGDAVKAAKAALDASVDAYNSYIAKVNEIRNYLSDPESDLDCPKGDLLADYTLEGNEAEPDEDNPYGSADYILMTLLPTTEQITEETTRITNLFQEAIAESLYDGKNCTNLLVNPDFSDKSGKGWTKAKGSPVMHGGLESFPCAELWHATFDIYQDVNNVPDGIYELSLNGFCRFDNGQTEVPAFIYMNEFESPLMSIDGDVIPFDQAKDGINCYLTSGATSAALTDPASKFYENPVNTTNDFTDTPMMRDGEGWTSGGEITACDGFRPNSMQGASVAFSADRYKAKTYGLVTGGKMRIGVRNLTDSQVWALWSNFKLTYRGKNEEALNAILPSYLEELANYDELNQDELTDPTKAENADAIAKGEKASDVDEMYEALIVVNDALVAAKKNKAAVEAFKAQEEALNVLAETYEVDVPSYDAITDDIAAWSEKTTDELDALVSKMKNVAREYTCAGLLSVADLDAAEELKDAIAEATAEEPVDVSSAIVNPDFTQGDVEGWTVIFDEVSNSGYQSAKYGPDDVINQFVEGWRQGAPLGDGYIMQAIVLPAGQYILSADVISKDQVNNEEVTGMTLFAGKESVEVSAESAAPGHYEVPFALGETSAILIGIAANGTNGNWVGADNFKIVCVSADVTAVENIASNSVVSEIYSVAGARISKMQKGINIVKMSNGTVQKVLVK